MSDRPFSELTGTIDRRRAMTGLALTMAAFAAFRSSFAQPPAQAMEKKAGADANREKTSLLLTAEFNASPQRIYSVLLDSKQFAALTGLPALIDPHPGGSFSLFQDQIVGRNVELVQDHRIVQAWRPAHWDPGVYSIVRFDLKPSSAGTSLTLNHSSFPEGEFEHLTSGWNEHYLNPLHKQFS